MQTISMKDLKNIDEIERLCKKENGPIFVSKNDKRCLVLMDIDYYENNLRGISEAKMIAEGLEDVVSNNVEDGDMAIFGIKAKYGI